MAQIVGVRFNRAGRVYYFHASGLGLNVNDDVIVQTSQGLELGKVKITSAVSITTATGYLLYTTDLSFRLLWTILGMVL